MDWVTMLGLALIIIGIADESYAYFRAPRYPSVGLGNPRLLRRGGGQLPSINISEIKLSFLCNGIPTKAVLITNYGNFTYLLVS